MTESTEWSASDSWIWTSRALPDRNAWVRFRRQLDFGGGQAELRITADARYVLYVNGAYVGQGPARSWPAHYSYDTYDLEPYLRSDVENILAVLVQHLGEGTFQYVYVGEYPGLLAEVRLGGETVVSDSQWRASPEPALASAVPRISVQEGFEEQHDARLADDWTSARYDDSSWDVAVELRPAADGVHRDPRPRDIPALTLEPVLPQRVVSAESVRSQHYRFTIYAKPYLAPRDRSSNHVFAHAYLVTQVWSPEDADATFTSPHNRPGRLKVNGGQVEDERARLHSGWNSVAYSLRYPHHFNQYVVCVEGQGLRFAAAGERGGASWAVVGPFGLGARDREVIAADIDESIVVGTPAAPEATVEAGEAFWESGDVASAVDTACFQQISPEHQPAVDVFVQAYTDRAVGKVALSSVDGLLSGAEWTEIAPPEDGSDVRILLDFGREVIGYHRFEVVASAGTALDWHNFEFIQPDGRLNFAEGMNNSFRYVCRDGTQRYQSIVRRGFQYSYLILRNLAGPVRIGRVEVLVATYPQRRLGRFACSDYQLDRIWEVGAHTLRLCAEDTYTDCPTYEQTHWVGDARNEALVDWTANGDPRLWFHCLEQTAQSLDRSPIVESHVPSSWQSLLPAWTFLWMRSCREYLLHTGDRVGAATLLRAVDRNVQGFRGFLNSKGLFEIHAWNMFDWAAMDTPSRGVVTHQNCLAVHALRDAAELADWLAEPVLAGEWRALSADLARAIDAHLWVEERQAYTDCLRDGQPSGVFSQQTQTVAYMSGVAAGVRAERCQEIMHNPPEGFVRAGSPFFEFFLLEAYQRESRPAEFLDTIRRDWGFMADQGASTFWEMWTWRGGRLTRSHCHGWSAAPTYFLSTYVLGVRPEGAGAERVVVEPHPADLRWCRGSVPTARGVVDVQWENEEEQPFALRVSAPNEATLELRLPREGRAYLNGRSVQGLPSS